MEHFASVFNVIKNNMLVTAHFSHAFPKEVILCYTTASIKKCQAIQLFK